MKFELEKTWFDLKIAADEEFQVGARAPQGLGHVEQAKEQSPPTLGNLINYESLPPAPRPEDSK